MNVVYLKHSRIGKGLDDDELDLLSRIVKLRRYPADTQIFDEGSPSNELYIIKKGKVKITKSKGNKKIEVGFLKEGDCFGELALSGESIRNAGAETVEPTEVFVLTLQDFEEFARKHPYVAYRILRNILQFFASKMKEMAPLFEFVLDEL